MGRLLVLIPCLGTHTHKENTPVHAGASGDSASTLLPRGASLHACAHPTTPPSTRADEHEGNDIRIFIQLFIQLFIQYCRPRPAAVPAPSVTARNIGVAGAAKGPPRLCGQAVCAAWGCVACSMHAAVAHLIFHVTPRQKVPQRRVKGRWFRRRAFALGLQEVEQQLRPRAHDAALWAVVHTIDARGMLVAHRPPSSLQRWRGNVEELGSPGRGSELSSFVDVVLLPPARSPGRAVGRRGILGEAYVGARERLGVVLAAGNSQ